MLGLLFVFADTYTYNIGIKAHLNLKAFIVVGAAGTRENIINALLGVALDYLLQGGFLVLENLIVGVL